MTALGPRLEVTEPAMIEIMRRSDAQGVSRVMSERFIENLRPAADGARSWRCLLILAAGALSLGVAACASVDAPPSVGRCRAGCGGRAYADALRRIRSVSG